MVENFNSVCLYIHSLLKQFHSVHDYGNSMTSDTVNILYITLLSTPMQITTFKIVCIHLPTCCSNLLIPAKSEASGALASNST